MLPTTPTYPPAKWRPLGDEQTEPMMRAHDIFGIHTMVGGLLGTDGYFRRGNGLAFQGTESHYGVGGDADGPELDGEPWQWQDRLYEADANLEGNPRIISAECSDGARTPVPPFSPAQYETLAQLIAWESTIEAHAACPADWMCHQIGIPLELIPDSKPGRRGVGYHRLGVDPWRVAGGELWSSSSGKICPGDARIAQLPGIIARAREIVGAGAVTPPPMVVVPTPLVVDGNLGGRTIRRWQHVMGTPVDGVISTPSTLVKAVQRHLNEAGAHDRSGHFLTVDGLGIGRNGKTAVGPTRTIEALQRYLGTPVDGVLSKGDSLAVRALQQRLDEGRF